MIRTAQMKADATATGTHRWTGRSITAALPGVFSVALLQSAPLGISAPLCFIAALVSLPMLTDALNIFNRSPFGAMLRTSPLRSRFFGYEYPMANGRVRVNHWLASENVMMGFLAHVVTLGFYHRLTNFYTRVFLISFRREPGETRRSGSHLTMWSRLGRR